MGRWLPRWFLTRFSMVRLESLVLLSMLRYDSRLLLMLLLRFRSFCGSRLKLVSGRLAIFRLCV